jgi:HAD superfamily hydrolase (TIGR01509 family)
VAVKVVAFDVGETLVDETGMWERAADAAGVPRFTLMGVLGGLAARRDDHARVWDILGVERPLVAWQPEELYPDALPCLGALRERGLRLVAAGNFRAEGEAMLRPHVDVVGSAGRWGAAKPSPLFFERIVTESGVTPAEIAYVGDRMDNDVEPAVAAGMVAVHIRRGPWGYLQAGSARAHVRISSLLELPDALAHV